MVWKGLSMVVTAVALSANPVMAQQFDIAGNWRGNLRTPPGELTLVISIVAGGDTGWIGSLALPQRGLSRLPIEAVTLTAQGAFSFDVSADGARYAGMLDPTDRVIRGTWYQAGQEIGLDFRALSGDVELPAALVRAQTPQPPFPYDLSEVTVDADVPLTGTLTMPRGGAEARPGVVLLTVAGANDRDQTHTAHKPYMVLADRLTRAGVAVLRCDDRGVGGSAGDLATTTISEMADDAIAMVEYLRAQPGVGPVGIIGNSEGTVSGTLAATRSECGYEMGDD